MHVKDLSAAEQVSVPSGQAAIPPIVSEWSKKQEVHTLTQAGGAGILEKSLGAAGALGNSVGSSHPPRGAFASGIVDACSMRTTAGCKVTQTSVLDDFPQKLQTHIQNYFLLRQYNLRFPTSRRRIIHNSSLLQHNVYRKDRSGLEDTKCTLSR
jgi:hypothetical protein